MTPSPWWVARVGMERGSVREGSRRAERRRGKAGDKRRGSAAGRPRHTGRQQVPAWRLARSRSRANRGAERARIMRGDRRREHFQRGGEIAGLEPPSSPIGREWSANGGVGRPLGVLRRDRARRATRVRGSEDRDYRGLVKRGLLRGQLPHRPEAAEACLRGRRAPASRPKRYGVLAEIELALVPCRPLLAWERGASRRRRRASSHACNFVKGELWLARGRNAWVSRPTPRTRESSYQDPLLLVLTPSRCQCGDDHSTFGSPLGRDRRVMTIPAARSAAAEALAS